MQGDSARGVPAEEAAAAAGVPDTNASNAGRPPQRTARAVAMVAGAVLAATAVVAGVVWAVEAIVNDDWDHVTFHATSYATSADPEWSLGGERDWELRPDRGRGERADRGCGEHGDRYPGKRARRDDGYGNERDGCRRADGSGRQAYGLEGCMTILSFGEGYDAAAVLLCRAPRAAVPDRDLGNDGGYFKFRWPPKFRVLPRDGFRGLPYTGPKIERWPFGPGMAPRDRGGEPLDEGEGPFRDRRPFDAGDLFEWFFENGAPFRYDGEQEDDLRGGPEGGAEDLAEDFLKNFPEGLFGDGGGGFRFRGEDGALRDRLCPSDGEEEQCLSALDQLSDEERERMERMLGILDGFGLGGFLGELLDSLRSSEFGHFESRAEPSGVTGA